MKLNDNGNLINRYYQEKKQFRKELFKWSRQITEYCAFESFIEYLLPADKFKLFNRKYQEHCEQLKEEEMFECNEITVDEEIYLNNDSKNDLLKQQDFDENSYFDEDYYSSKENQLNDEPLDLSNKEKISNFDAFTQQYLLKNENLFRTQAFDLNSSIDLLNLSKSICQAMALNDLNSKTQSLLTMNNLSGMTSATANPTTNTTTTTIASTITTVTPSTTTTTTNSTVTRRNYTKEELDKALADIQSGRIGTRRASVLYGIPRSTLRNKVFRLNNQKQHQQRTQPQQQQTANTTILKKQNENQTKFNEIKDKLLNNLSINFAYEKLFSKNNEKLNDDDDSIKYIKNSTTTTIEQPSIQQYLNSTMFKILKDVVSEKLFGLNVSSTNKLNENKLGKTANDLLTKMIPTNESNEQIKVKPSITLNSTSLNENNKFNLKQKRAKRGQYRKYESDQLNKAVDAVINGLMSVHKAGSHFGVPHSTLEYKVKERNMKSSSSSSSSSISTPSTPLTPNTANLQQSNNNNNNNKQSKITAPINDNKVKNLNNKPTILNENYLNDKNMFLFNNLVSSSQTNTPIPHSSFTQPLIASNYFSVSELLRKLYEGVHTTVPNTY